MLLTTATAWCELFATDQSRTD